MARVTLRSLGRSVVMTVPKKTLKLVDLDAGSRVKVIVEKGRLIIEPTKRWCHPSPEMLG